MVVNEFSGSYFSCSARSYFDLTVKKSRETSFRVNAEEYKFLYLLYSVQWADVERYIKKKFF